MLFHFTIGVFLAKKAFDFRILFKNGPIYGILLAIAFLYFDTEVPTFLENATFLISYATIFLVLMSLGIALTKLKVFSLKLSLINSFSRMVLGAYSRIYFNQIFKFRWGRGRRFLHSKCYAKCNFDLFSRIHVFTKKSH